MIDSRIDGPAWSYANAKDKTDYFSWSDDEVELLLSSIMDNKTLKEMENIDWESCQSKYQDIHNKFVEHYPTPEEAKALGKEYPHSKTQMMKAILTSKLKTIRQKYRLADNDGRRGGHGRVVLFYFKFTSNRYGVVLLTYHLALRQQNFQKCVLILKRWVPLSVVLQDSSKSQDIEGILPSTVVQERRCLTNSKLADHKHEKLKRKLPNEHA